MPIIYNSAEKIFHIQSSNTSYIIKVYNTGHVVNLFWGKKIKALSFSSRPITSQSNFDEKDALLPIDNIFQEYPGYGNGDFRSPAYQILQENGGEIRHQDDGKEEIAELRAARQVGCPVAGIHVADGDQQPRPDEGQQRAPETGVLRNADRPMHFCQRSRASIFAPARRFHRRRYHR